MILVVAWTITRLSPPSVEGEGSGVCVCVGGGGGGSALTPAILSFFKNRRLEVRERI